METMTWAMLLHRLAGVPRAHGFDQRQGGPRRRTLGVSTAMQAWAASRGRR